MPHYLYVLAIEAESDAVATDLQEDMEEAVRIRGLAPAPCNWIPDADTVADGLGIDYGKLSIVDMNPSRIE